MDVHGVMRVWIREPVIIGSSESGCQGHAIWAFDPDAVGCDKVLMIADHVCAHTGFPQGPITELSGVSGQALAPLNEALKVIKEVLDAPGVARVPVGILRLDPIIKGSLVHARGTGSSLAEAGGAVLIACREVSEAAGAHEDVELSRQDVKARVDDLDEYLDLRQGVIPLGFGVLGCYLEAHAALIVRCAAGDGIIEHAPQRVMIGRGNHVAGQHHHVRACVSALTTARPVGALTGRLRRGGGIAPGYGDAWSCHPFEASVQIPAPLDLVCCR